LVRKGSRSRMERGRREERDWAVGFIVSRG
jgi:hypothetical protein